MTGSRGTGPARSRVHRFVIRTVIRTTADRRRRPARTTRVTRVVDVQRHSRDLKSTKLSARRVTGVPLPRRNDMSSMIEDLARDRMREIQRDAEMTRRIRRARAQERAAKSARS